MDRGDLDLSGSWRAIEADDDLRRRLADRSLDDSGWATIRVPGQWRLHPAFATSDGPVLHRRRFEATVEPGARAWLVLDGVFYQSDVWLDGSYLGDTEGYFAPSSLEVTAPLAAAAEHLLAVEVACPPPADRRRKHALTGVFQHWDCIDPAWNPGGIWAPVRIERSGPVRIAALRVLCREASAERATVDLVAVLDSAAPTAVALDAALSLDGAPVAATEEAHQLATGTNVVGQRITVDRPALWWPRALGGQPLHDLTVAVTPAGGPTSDRRQLRTGLRRVRMRRLVVTVNGERMYAKGANLGPTDRALSSVGAAAVEGDLRAAAGAGLDLLRVHAHVAHPALYDAADRTGMLLWQDLPLQWGYGQVRRQAVRQARAAVDLLGHHPSVAVWCGHNEPLAIDLPPGGRFPRREVARFAVGQLLPSWNKTALDTSIRRALERADGTRPVVAHSGLLAHPGSDSHLYFGWYHGRSEQLGAALARWPALGRFVSELGAQAVPDSDDFVPSERWPDLPWAELAAAHGLQHAVLARHVPPDAFPTYRSWLEATQRYQADLVRHQVETLRRLKYRPGGGFCVFLLADAQPAVSWALLDHRRRPKAAFAALADACRPVLPVADRPAASYRPGNVLRADVHVVSDLRRDVEGAELAATLAWPGGRRAWRFAGPFPADSVTRVGRVVATIPPDSSPGPLTLTLELRYRDPATDQPTVVRSAYPSSVTGGHFGGGRPTLVPQRTPRSPRP